MSTKTTIYVSDVVNAFIANLPNLQRGQVYTLEQLVGSKFWHSIPKGQVNKLGAEFKREVKLGWVAVDWVGRGSDNIQQYQLK